MPSFICAFCGDIESIENSLMCCGWMKCIWFEVIDLIFDKSKVTSLVNWWKGKVLTFKRKPLPWKEMETMLVEIMWFIWKEWCEAIFRHRKPIPCLTVERILRFFKEESETRVPFA